MNKRLKRLICIWLVVIMLVGILPMTALAEDSKQPNAQIWTGTVPLREASEVELASGLKYDYIDPNKFLKDQELAETPEGTDLLNWVGWGQAFSGYAPFKSKKYELNQKVSESDLTVNELV